MTKYIWDRDKHVFVPAHSYVRPKSMGGPMIMRDIDPYKSVITGEPITSRSHHREHLRRHGCEEVGNEKPKFMRDREEARRG